VVGRAGGWRWGAGDAGWRWVGAAVVVAVLAVEDGRWLRVERVKTEGVDSGWRFALVARVCSELVSL
jgi:hypothetical protein